MSSDVVVRPIKWSYSSLSSFSDCPKRYLHERELKDVVGKTHEAAAYGTLAHEAAEAFLKHGTAVPMEFSYMQPLLDMLKQMPGELHSEIDLSLRFDYTPTESTAEDAWFRGFSDIVVVDGERALVADFKFGKSRYAKLEQLEIYALAVFRRFPQVKKVRGLLLFVREDQQFKADYKVEDAPDLWLKWISRVDKIRQAREFNNWPAKRSGLCRFCPVTSCSEHPEWSI